MNHLKKVLKFISTGIVTLMFIGCYGVLMPFSATLNIKNSDGVGVPNLKISYKKQVEDLEWIFLDYTDLDGNYQFSNMSYNQEEYIFKIEDIDADLNLGNFQSKIVTLNDDLDNIILK